LSALKGFVALHWILTELRCDCSKFANNKSERNRKRVKQAKCTDKINVATEQFDPPAMRIPRKSPEITYSSQLAICIRDGSYS